MNAKTMEGLAGAGASMAMMSIPMNVAKEAERKGETDKMQRALVLHPASNQTFSTAYFAICRVVVSQRCHRIASFLRLAD